MFGFRVQGGLGVSSFGEKEGTEEKEEKEEREEKEKKEEKVEKEEKEETEVPLLPPAMQSGPPPARPSGRRCRPGRR